MMSDTATLQLGMIETTVHYQVWLSQMREILLTFEIEYALRHVLINLLVVPELFQSAKSKET